MSGALHVIAAVVAFGLSGAQSSEQPGAGPCMDSEDTGEHIAPGEADAQSAAHAVAALTGVPLPASASVAPIRVPLPASASVAPTGVALPASASVASIRVPLPASVTVALLSVPRPDRAGVDVGPARAAADSWTSEDKFRHVAASWAVAVFAYAAARSGDVDAETALVIALPVAGAAGVAKEIADYRAGGPFSLRDLAADALGAGVAWLFLREVR